MERNDGDLEAEPGEHQGGAGQREQAGSGPKATPLATSGKVKEPVAPYRNAAPYSRIAEPIEPSTRYLKPDSSDFSRQISSAQST